MTLMAVSKFISLKLLTLALFVAFLPLGMKTLRDLTPVRVEKYSVDGECTVYKISRAFPFMLSKYTSVCNEPNFR